MDIESQPAPNDVGRYQVVISTNCIRNGLRVSQTFADVRWTGGKTPDAKTVRVIVRSRLDDAFIKMSMLTECEVATIPSKDREMESFVLAWINWHHLVFHNR